MSRPLPPEFPLRSNLLPRLYEESRRSGWIAPEAVASIGRDLRIPVAEAWEVATSYADFSFEPVARADRQCGWLACRLAGSDAPGHCQFRCYDAPASGSERPFPADMVRLAGPLLEPEHAAGQALAAVRAMGREQAVVTLVEAGLRGRGGAYFPTGVKWQNALAENRPVALVINAEEGEPGVFKDRALLSVAPQRVAEGIAIAAFVLQPVVVVLFVNGHADPMAESFSAALAGWPLDVEPVIVRGGGGYVLGEEGALLNAIEGRRPVPRTRPPFPAQSGLFGMPTVVNNVETLANLPIIFSDPDVFRTSGESNSPGTRILSVSGRVERPGVYEVPLGTSLRELIGRAGPVVSGAPAVLMGGPSGGFLAASAFDTALSPGLMHPTGAMLGAGGITVFDAPGDIREAALMAAAFNAAESCGKCTPCREGTPRLLDALAAGDSTTISDLGEVLQFASLCGLGQMAPGPVRSALHFWPEVFA